MNYDLDRFITAQEHDYAGALEEIIVIYRTEGKIIKVI